MAFLMAHKVEVLSFILLIEQILPKVGLVKANSTTELISNFIFGTIKRLLGK